jgi:hypothetical protein
MLRTMVRLWIIWVFACLGEFCWRSLACARRMRHSLMVRARRVATLVA